MKSKLTFDSVADHSAVGIYNMAIPTLLVVYTM